MFDQNPAITIYLEDLKIGMQATRTREITDRDIELFSEVSGDRNPVHLDDAFAAKSIFSNRIAHGMLTASMFSAVIGEQLPGNGCIYLGQSLKFVAPVYPGDTVIAHVEITEINHERARVMLECRCTVGDKTVLTGTAEVLAPRRPSEE